MNSKTEDKFKDNKEEESKNSKTISNLIEHKLEDIFSKSIDNIIQPGNFDKILEKIIQKKYNEELVNRTSFQNIKNISKNFKRADIDDDIEDIIIEPKPDEKETISSVTKEPKKTPMKYTKNLKKDKKKNKKCESKKSKSDSEVEKEEDKENEINEPEIKSYVHKDENGNNYIYTYQRRWKDHYDFRCKDYKCKGRGKYYFKSNQFTITQICTIVNYEDHNYAKKQVIKDKISKKIVTDEEMNTKEFQEQYIKNLYKIYPTLKYNEVIEIMLNNYNIKNIYYTNTMYNNYKKDHLKKMKVKKSNENFIDEIELFRKKLLLAKLKFNPEPIQINYNLSNSNLNKDDKIIRIYGTLESISLLSNKDINQYYIDGTYKCIPFNSPDIKVLIILICYNQKKDLYELCLASTFSHEDTDTFITFYTYLKNMYLFNPRYITCDFAMANIKAIQIVFAKDNCTIITCLFHLIQSWWRRASLLGLRKKKNLSTTKAIIFNMKMLPFMNKNDAIEFYKKIKEIPPDNSEEFKTFFEYFENTYLSLEKDIHSKYEFSLWNYTDKIKIEGNKNSIFKENNYKTNFDFSNNCCESLNHLINEILDVNNNVSTTKFSEIIKFIFIRFNVNREKNNQNKEQIRISHKLSDNLLALAKFGIGKNKVLKSKDIKSIKNLNNEEDIFKFILFKNKEDDE